MFDDIFDQYKNTYFIEMLTLDYLLKQIHFLDVILS